MDLDGPGKFETYRRKYIMLFCALLRETCDVNWLELLVTKLSKDSVIAQQHDLLGILHSSLVHVRPM